MSFFRFAGRTKTTEASTHWRKKPWFSFFLKDWNDFWRKKPLAQAKNFNKKRKESGGRRVCCCCSCCCLWLLLLLLLLLPLAFAFALKREKKKHETVAVASSCRRKESKLCAQNEWRKSPWKKMGKWNFGTSSKDFKDLFCLFVFACEWKMSSFLSWDQNHFPSQAQERSNDARVTSHEPLHASEEEKWKESGLFFDKFWILRKKKTTRMHKWRPWKIWMLSVCHHHNQTQVLQQIGKKNKKEKGKKSHVIKSIELVLILTREHPRRRTKVAIDRCLHARINRLHRSAWCL